MKKNVILFLCHIINGKTKQRFFNIKNTLPEGYDIFWAFDGEHNDSTPNINWFNFNWNELCQKYGKGYFTKGHFKNIIYFLFPFREQYRYDYYWVIEYDVIMNGGDWKPFFEEMKKYNYDFISSQIGPFFPKFHNSILLLKGVDETITYESFNPIFRISSKSLHKVKDFYLANDCYYNFALPSNAIENKNDFLNLEWTKWLVLKYFKYINVNNYQKIKQDGILLHPVK